MAKTDDQLIEAVIRRDGRALRELLRRLRPHCRGTLWDRYKTLGSVQADILDEAESLLFEWTLEPRARERFRPGESLGALAFRLVAEVVRQRIRPEQRQAKIAAYLAAESEGDSAPPPEASFGTEAIEEALVALPEAHRRVIVAEVRFQRGEGPPLAEALGVTMGAARVRLHRARTLLFKALVDKGLIDPQEKIHG
jgi:DNA-directed RNA polymerase specialized sigma24 family protein